MISPGKKITMGGEEFTAFQTVLMKTADASQRACVGCTALNAGELCENLKAHCGPMNSFSVVFARSESELAAARVAWKLAHA